MPRLFVEPALLRAGRIEVRGEDHHYLFRVLRLRIGAAVELFDGEGRQAAAVVASIDGELGALEAGEPEPATPPPGAAITALIPLLKADRSADSLAKLVELGVSRIVPVVTARSVVRVDVARADDRHRRLIAQARAAARQCQSAFVPRIERISDWKTAVATTDAALRLVLWERADTPLRALLPAQAPASIAVATGPEGGLEAAEVDAAIAAGFLAVALGPRILRAETAPVAVCAILRFLFGDVG